MPMLGGGWDPSAAVQRSDPPRLRGECFEFCRLAKFLPHLHFSLIALARQRLGTAWAHGCLGGGMDDMSGFMGLDEVVDKSGLCAEDVAFIVETLVSVVSPQGMKVVQGGALGQEPAVIDVRCFLLALLVMQHTSLPSQVQRIDATDVWPTSPRDGSIQKPKSAVGEGSTFQELSSFLHRYVTDGSILFCISPAVIRAGSLALAADVCLTSRELKSLDLLFRRRTKGLDLPVLPGAHQSVAQYQTWMTQNLDFMIAGEDVYFTDTGGVSRPAYRLERRQKTTVVLDEGEVKGGTLLISHCHDTFIYVLAPTKSVSIRGCSKCTIFLGVVASAINVEHCKATSIIGLCSYVRAFSCTATTLYVACNEPPAVLGHNTDLFFAPYNCSSVFVCAQMAEVGLVIEENSWNRPRLLGSHADNTCARKEFDSSSKTMSEGIPLEDTCPSFILPPEDFTSFCVPFEHQVDLFEANGTTPHDDRMTALPPSLSIPLEYRQVLDERLLAISTLRKSVRESEMSEERRNELHCAIQLHFRAWLLSSDNARHIEQLVQLSEKASPPQ